jgi:hypothetical protein
MARLSALLSGQMNAESDLFEMAPQGTPGDNSRPLYGAEYALLPNTCTRYRVLVSSSMDR